MQIWELTSKPSGRDLWYLPVYNNFYKQKLNDQNNWRYSILIKKILKVCYNRYNWGAGKQGSEYTSWFRQLPCISRTMKMSNANFCANQAQNGGRDGDIDAMRAISVKSYLNIDQK